MARVASNPFGLHRFRPSFQSPQFIQNQTPFHYQNNKKTRRFRSISIACQTNPDPTEPSSTVPLFSLFPITPSAPKTLNPLLIWSNFLFIYSGKAGRWAWHFQWSFKFHRGIWFTGISKQSYKQADSSGFYTRSTGAFLISTSRFRCFFERPLCCRITLRTGLLTCYLFLYM